MGQSRSEIGPETATAGLLVHVGTKVDTLPRLAKKKGGQVAPAALENTSMSMGASFGL